MRVTVASFIVMSLFPSFLCAQETSASDATLLGQFKALFKFGECSAELLCISNANGSSMSDVFAASLSENQELLVEFVTSAIGFSTANIPVPATSSGVIRLPNSQVVLSTGPIYAERAPTIGRGRLLVGVNFSAINFQRLRGVPLDKLTFNFQHADIPGTGPLGDPEYENNLLTVDTELDVRMYAASLFATLGVANRLDVGIAVPILRISMVGRSHAQIVPFGASRTSVYFWGNFSEDPKLQIVKFMQGTSTGIGDVSGRAKLNIYQSLTFGAALLGDVRFPTGDTEQFLGAGEFAARILGIASASFGGFTPHVNVGYLFRNRPDTLQNHAVLANVGYDQLLHRSVTLVVDVISEWKIDLTKVDVPGPFQYHEPFFRTVEASSVPSGRDNRIDASFGLKLTPGTTPSGRGVTFVLGSLIPLNSGGLRPGAVWSASVEFKF